MRQKYIDGAYLRHARHLHTLYKLQLLCRYATKISSRSHATKPLSGQKTNATEKKEFTLPASKTKIYAYLEALVGETKSEKEKIKEANRDYRNQKHWNLDPEHPSLKPLKSFLDPFFST